MLHHPTMKLATIGILCLVGAAAQSPRALYNTFYPTNLNSTQWITDNAIGTYGGLYNAGTYSSKTNATYGTYDYCFMPHPRAQEYQLPGPVGNGSLKAELVYLQYLQRHQRRTPYNILPGGENQPFNCNNINPYLYAGPAIVDGASTQMPIQVYAETYTDPSNPFLDAFVRGTCQYPQLTVGGLYDAYQHGKDLWSVYGEKLGFLPSNPDESTWFRSTESPLTQQSAGGVLRGIWPQYTQPVPLHQQAQYIDTVDQSFTCDYRDTVLAEITSSSAWEAQLKAAAPLLADLSWATQNSSDWTDTFDHLCDNFQARLCNGYELPCNVNDTSECVTMKQAEEAFRAGDWEWNYYWRASKDAMDYIQTTEGLFIGEMLKRFATVEAGTSTIKYEHDFLHDGDIGPIAGALGIEALRWPGMGSNIAFELWMVENGALYARVLYSGQPMKSIHGTLDWIPLSKLVEILEPFVPEDAVALCSSS